MKENIQAGIIADVGAALKKISEAFFKFMDKISDFGVEITKKEEKEDGSLKFWCKYNGKDFGLMITPVMNKDGSEIGKVNILINFNGKDTKIDNVDASDVVKVVKETLNKLMDIDFSGSANSSKKLRVTLQKVVSNDESIINMTAITANYDFDEANRTLDVVLDNEDFLNEISEEPTSFEITDNDDELDIQSISEFDVSDTMQSVLDAYNDFCTKAKNLKDMLEFYYANFSYEEQLGIDQFINDIDIYSPDNTYDCF